MSYPGVNPAANYLNQAKFTAPNMEESGRRIPWSSIGKAAGKACAMPFRIASTVVNGGVFAAYYVTAVAVTGLAATGGAVFGIGKIVIDVIRGKPHKSLLEYTIIPARATFNYISGTYYELPKHGPEMIFASPAIAALIILAVIIQDPAVMACIDPPPSPDKRPDDDYNPSGFSALLHPYRPSIVLGRKIMGKTTQVLNRGQVD